MKINRYFVTNSHSKSALGTVRISTKIRATGITSLTNKFNISEMLLTGKKRQVKPKRQK